MRYKVLFFVSGLLLGLGVFESMGGYFSIVNQEASTGMPAYYGLINGWLFYLLALFTFLVRYMLIKRNKEK